ncbi:MAG: Holliday junction branch migration protein RuvA [Parcubacteria group bacterium CG08_land_8_20_14_0_20_48_21]|nr:MAG: Holliday junction DNA helicase RuvA [Parcubacteria group bacterium CG2_30_48_51]PIS32876.1 MAG: Holliday junction branch migration protein RuvA [Parcubacteria group bacterium CG08_land_8_20_14_0_20_48_21]PIW78786.1 MAG: Holliday junction branch migration protein RuvA [Parcubacteria group bacterium CG_4_8_14_3_um_filter_48_16]PIY78245.1 MAG: Holliday junction branch migration protein RuvA [Parcubacteria group bacterium CG_4_10_14_0_8_um_filter_48_154]PIZ77596.1 MAG: Holliday junction bra
MIYTLFGTITHKNDRFLVVEASQVGYQVFVTDRALRDSVVGKELMLFTHQHVREDALLLYGFAAQDELIFFEQLLSISGIGPKSALGVMGVASVADLRAAIQKGDTHFLTRISGIGKKTAERVTLELRGKLTESSGSGVGTSEMGGTMGEEIEALEGLGYSVSSAREALAYVSAEVTDVAERVKAALQILSKNRK